MGGSPPLGNSGSDPDSFLFEALDIVIICIQFSKHKWSKKEARLLLKALVQKSPHLFHCELITWSHLVARFAAGIPWPRSHFPAPLVYYRREKKVLVGS